MLVIQLWPAGIELTDKPHAVWIGNISFHQKQLPLASKDGLLSLFDKPHYLPALRQLSAGASGLAKHGFKLVKGKVTREGWKKRALDLPDWDGQRLIILQQ